MDFRHSSSRLPDIALPCVAASVEGILAIAIWFQGPFKFFNFMALKK
jgi:hypothetical protein